MLVLLAVGCAPDTPPDTATADTAAPVDWSAPGPYGAGTVGLSLSVEGRDTPIPARVWYPAASGGDLALEDLVADTDDRAALATLLADAPEGCPARRNAAVEGAAPADTGPSPLVVLSHCHTCLGLSGATIAAQLATHGTVVVAPDHSGNTLFDALDGDGGALDEATLAQRARDVSAAIDAALAGEGLPDGVTVDPDRIGAAGHSFGAVTTGRVLATDDRVRAAVAMAAPIDNPLLRGVDAATVTEPTLHLLLEEDGSVGTAGNLLIEANYAEVAGPAWLARMPDAGHWSVSDLCGVVPGFLPGCGEGIREETGETFAYVAADDGRATAAALTAAFFAATLDGDPEAEAWLTSPSTAATVEVESR